MIELPWAKFLFGAIMSDEVTVEYAILNIAASPHPDGVYEELLNRAALQPVNYWGSHFATISRPVRERDGFLRGRIVCWVEIDKSEPAVFKDKLEEVDFNDLDIDIPNNVGFNSKVFLYVFREKDHSMFIETSNDLGKKLSPRQARRILELLMGPTVQGNDAPLVEVTTIPEEDTLRRIFSMSKLKRLRIHIVRPNADDLDVERILERLEGMGVRSEDKVLVAATDNGGITPDEETRTEAEVAEHNGFVQGVGYEEDGTRIDLSTKEYPRTIKKRVDQFGSAVAEIMSVALETFLRPPRL